MKAEKIQEVFARAREYILDGILYFYKKVDDKNYGVVLLPNPVDLSDGSGNYITGIDIEFNDVEITLLFHQKNEYDDPEDPQYLHHLKIEELIEVLSELEQLTGLEFDQSFNF
ncbi:hypothetical protein [Pseudoflavitalea rhizosphaerae]|uniref:hypothetical protein n=1 Tax=Pseudoflavitalea rhizosphaerae TaxID=1884793 RepID=UPI000F8EEDAD|nr:hypothetical protein [Pseudoflavitalea rhizosphaerae]